MSTPNDNPDHDELRRMVDDDPDLVDRLLNYLVTILPELSNDKAKLLQANLELRRHFAGSEVYVRKRSRSLPDEVLELFNGRNATEVARQLGIGRATVYRVLKQAGRPR